MKLNQFFELSMVLDTDHFQKIFRMAYNGSGYISKDGEEHIDTSLSSKGITVFYRDSQYKKKVRLIVNTRLLLEDASDTDKLLRKLDKRIREYFNFKISVNDFTLSGMNLIADIDVGSRANVSDYLKVLRRVGKVKGFSPTSYDGIDENSSFCLSGNSNAIDFLLYDLEQAVVGHLLDNDVGHKKITSASGHTQGILRAEVWLTKHQAIRAYTEEEYTAGQIIALSKKCRDVFLDTFTRIIPFGDFYKKDKAAEIVWHEVKDNVVRRKMIRLLTLIPEKKSLYLAQKAMGCRDVKKVMDFFAKINLSPVTISKCHDVKHMENIYSYFLK